MRGSVVYLIGTILILGLAVAGSGMVAAEEAPRSSFVGSVYVNEHFLMVIQADKAVVHALDGTGLKSSAVRWVVETFTDSGWAALDWTTPPSKEIRNAGGFHEVVSSGTLEGGIMLTVSHRGLPVDVPESGPKITATVQNGAQPSYFRVGWKVEGVTSSSAQLEVRTGSLRTFVAAISDEREARTVLRADDLANSIVFLDAEGDISFGMNWEDALTLHDRTVLVSDGADITASVYFGPFQLEAGESVVVDPVIEGGGGGGGGGTPPPPCSLYINGYVKSAIDGTYLAKAKVNVGSTVTYTSAFGYYKVYVSAGTYSVTAKHTAHKDSPAQSATAYQTSSGYCVKPRVDFSLLLENGGSINMHPRDAGGLAAETQAAFNKIVELRAEHVRSDFAWAAFQPNGPADHLSISWWSDYLNWANTAGLDVIVLLTSPPTWAKNLYNGYCAVFFITCLVYVYPDKEAFFDAWRNYCREIASHFGDRVYYYQMANEENHFIHSFVGDADEARLFNECYEGLISGEGTTAANHKKHFRTIVNAWADAGQLGWDQTMRRWLTDAGGAIDIAAVDHYPGTWCCFSFTEWGPVEQLLGIVREYGKWGAVMETGFSTWGWDLWNPNYQWEQTIFIHDAFVTIRGLIRPHNQVYLNNKIMLLNWYELVDVRSDGGGTMLPPFGERHFGIYSCAPGPCEAISPYLWAKKEGWGELQFHLGDDYNI